MEEKQIQTEESVVQNYEPVMTDNFDSETAENYSTTEFLGWLNVWLDLYFSVIYSSKR